MLAVSLACSSSWSIGKKGQVLTRSLLAEGTSSLVGMQVSPAREFVWSLYYLKALELYNAKQVPFFFIYGSYISPLYYCHAFFLAWQLITVKIHCLQKYSTYHSLQENEFRIKGKIYIGIYMQKKKISIFILSPWTHIPHWIWIWGPQSHFDQSSGGFF